MKTMSILMAYLLCAYTISFAQPGALDASFANGGKFIAPDNYNAHEGSANAVAVQKDGKIIMAGRVLITQVQIIPVILALPV